MNEKNIALKTAETYNFVWNSGFNATEFRDTQVSLPPIQNNFIAVTFPFDELLAECEPTSYFVVTVMPDSGSMNWEAAELAKMVRKYYEPTEAITCQKHSVRFEPIWMSGQGITFRPTGTEEEHYLQSDVTEPASNLDKETEDMCLKHDLLPYIGEIRSSIYETYHNVISVEPKRTEDPEIEDYEKVCFEIHLSGESTQILEDEERFYAIFFKEIPEDKQEFFTFTYCIL